jgi:cystine transport system permease protein
MDHPSILDLAARLLPSGVANIVLTLLVFPVSLILASLTAGVRLMRIPVVSQVAAIYVDVFRMTPLVLWLFFAFYALPFLGVTLDAWPAAAVTFAVSSAAYQSEAMRAAYLSVPKGYLEAAQVLGMDRRTTLLRVSLPIAIRVAIPPLGNTLIELFRASSFVALLAIPDVVFTGLNLINRFHEPQETLLLVGLFFVVLGVPAARGLKWVERRVAIP